MLLPEMTWAFMALMSVPPSSTDGPPTVAPTSQTSGLTVLRFSNSIE